MTKGVDGAGAAAVAGTDNGSNQIAGANYKVTLRSRNAFAITETELKLMAAPAMMGLRRRPKNG